MVPYFMLVGIPALIALLLHIARANKKKANQIVIDSFFLIWLILLILRSESVGTDLLTYKFHFNNYPLLSWEGIFSGVLAGEFEAGYVLIVKGLSYLTTDFRWIIVVFSCITVIPIWRLYREEGNYSFLLIVLFLNIAPFSMYFSGLRQAAAMAFIAPCYRFCKEKKFWPYLVMIFFAFLFHRSAVILLLMYPVFHMRLKRQLHLLYLIPIVILIYAFNERIFAILLWILGGLYSDSAIITSTGAYAVTLLLTVLLVYSYLIPNQEDLDDETVGLRNLLILGTVIQIFSAVNTVAMRMNYYYLLLIPLLITKVIKNGNPKFVSIIRVSVICMIIFFTVYYFYYAYTDDDILHVYPYEFFFQQTPTMY